MPNPSKPMMRALSKLMMKVLTRPMMRVEKS
jgi:hypothetical protein